MVTVTRTSTRAPVWIDHSVHAGTLRQRAARSPQAETRLWTEDALSPRSSSIDDLSPRQREILMLHIRGLTRDQIAGQLEISANTVRNHVQAIYDRTGCANRIQALRWALRQPMLASRILGWIPGHEPAGDCGDPAEHEELDIGKSLTEIILAVRFFQDLVVCEDG